MFITVTYIEIQVDQTSTLLHLNVEPSVTEVFNVFLLFLGGYGWGSSSVVGFLPSIWEALGLNPIVESKKLDSLVVFNPLW